MRTAQGLYEGIDVGEGVQGLITYMRTDSIALSQECLDELRALIPERYGKDYLPEAVNVYKNKSKNAQEAHEAIRPTSVRQLPQDVKRFLSDDQYKLYNLIWKRTLASQMIHATIDQVAVDLACGDGNAFRATGSTITHPGFMRVYREDRDDAKAEDDDRTPAPDRGRASACRSPTSCSASTSPSPRRASPRRASSRRSRSTASGARAPTPRSSPRSRAANTSRSSPGASSPTDTGRVVSRFLSQHFDRYVDYDFTAQLEDELDAVSPRREALGAAARTTFWTPFKERVADKMENVSREEAVEESESSAPIRRRANPWSCASAATGRWPRSATATTRRSRASRAFDRASA